MKSACKCVLGECNATQQQSAWAHSKLTKKIYAAQCETYRKSDPHSRTCVSLDVVGSVSEECQRGARNNRSSAHTKKRKHGLKRLLVNVGVASRGLDIQKVLRLVELELREPEADLFEGRIGRIGAVDDVAADVDTEIAYEREKQKFRSWDKNKKRTVSLFIRAKNRCSWNTSCMCQIWSARNKDRPLWRPSRSNRGHGWRCGRYAEIAFAQEKQNPNLEKITSNKVAIPIRARKVLISGCLLDH